MNEWPEGKYRFAHDKPNWGYVESWLEADSQEGAERQAAAWMQAEYGDRLEVSESGGVRIDGRQRGGWSVHSEAAWKAHLAKCPSWSSFGDDEDDEKGAE